MKIPNPLFILSFLLIIAHSIHGYGQREGECAALVVYYLENNANDAGPHAQHGSVNGASLAPDRFQVANGAYRFDGINDDISVPYDSLLNDTFSLSAWVKVRINPADGEAQAIFSFGSSGADHSLMLSNNSNFNHYGLGFGSIGNIQSNIWQGSMPDTGKWYHMAVTRTATTLKLWINGQFADSLVTQVPIFGSSPSASIGSRRGANQFFKGDIDEVRYYKCLLNESQIINLASDTLGNTTDLSSNIQSKISIFPNPASDHIQISGNYNKYIIRDQNAKIVLDGFPNEAIDIKSLNAGFYLVEVLTNSGTIRRKVILEK